MQRRMIPGRRGWPVRAVAVALAAAAASAAAPPAWAGKKKHLTPKELRPEIDDMPDPAGKVKLTAIFFDDDAKTGRTAVQLSRAFRLFIKKDERFAFYEISKLLEQGKLESERTTIAKARSEFDRGRALFEDIAKVSESVPVLEGAAESYRAVLGYVPRKEEWVEVLMYYASALYMEGKKDKKKEVELLLREALLLSPEMAYDEDRYPARMVSVFDKVREGISTAGRGSVEIVSDPPFAEVYVNGSYRGVTPIEVFGLPEGENYVTLRKDGYKKYADTMTVEAEKSTSYEASLAPVFKLELYDDIRRGVKPELGETKAGKAIRTAGDSVFIVNQMVFVTLTPEEDSLRATLFLYDMRSRLLLKKVSGLVDPKAGAGDMEGSIREMVTELFSGVRLDGSVERPEDKIDVDKRGKRPIYNRWWFWTAVGGVVLAGALVPTTYFAAKSAETRVNFCDRCGAVFFEF